MKLKYVRRFFFCILLLLVSCASHTETQTLVLKYEDFGPQALAWQFLGMEWWQWDTHDDDDPKTAYQIGIIAYRNIPLGIVKRHYTVNEAKTLDDRYAAYADALRYLHTNIADINKEIKDLNELKTEDKESKIGWRTTLLQTLQHAHHMIEDQLGK